MVGKLHVEVNARVRNALLSLAPEERDLVVKGFALYVDALRNAGETAS